MKKALLPALSALVFITGIVTVAVVHHHDMKAEMARRERLGHLQH